MSDRQLAALITVYLFLLPALSYLAWASVTGYDGQGPCFIDFPDTRCDL